MTPITPSFSREETRYDRSLKEPIGTSPMLNICKLFLGEFGDSLIKIETDFKISISCYTLNAWTNYLLHSVEAIWAYTLVNL